MQQWLRKTTLMPLISGIVYADNKQMITSTSKKNTRAAHSISLYLIIAHHRSHLLEVVWGVRDASERPTLTPKSWIRDPDSDPRTPSADSRTNRRPSKRRSWTISGRWLPHLLFSMFLPVCAAQKWCTVHMYVYACTPVYIKVYFFVQVQLYTLYCLSCTRHHRIIIIIIVIIDHSIAIAMSSPAPRSRYSRCVTTCPSIIRCVTIWLTKLTRHLPAWHLTTDLTLDTWRVASSKKTSYIACFLHLYCICLSSDLCSRDAQ